MDNKGGIHHFEVPPDLRAATEKNIEQARAAFNKFISASARPLPPGRGRESHPSLVTLPCPLPIVRLPLQRRDVCSDPLLELTQPAAVRLHGYGSR
jgi:hypothetical protein